MSYSKATVRAASPFPTGLGAVVQQNSSNQSRLRITHYATTTSEIVASIPEPWRTHLDGNFKRLADAAEKLAKAQVTLAALARHKAAGTFPTPIKGLHAPAFDFSKEFKGSHPTRIAIIQSDFEAYQVAALDRIIALKTEEVQYLTEQTSVEHILPAWIAAINEITEVETPNYQECVTLTAAAKVARSASDVGPLSLTTSGAFVGTAGQLQETIGGILNRFVQICKRKLHLDAEKRTKKVAVKAAADVVMADGTMAGPSSGPKLAELVRQEVAKSLATQKKVRRTIAVQPLTYSFSGIEKRRKSSRTSTIAAQKGKQAWTAKTRLERKVEEVMLSTWFAGTPDSYPDLIIHLPFHIAVECVVARTPEATKEVLRSRGRIHLGSGVFIPDNLQIHVSAGLNYMLPQHKDPSLVKNAYIEFCRTLRWRIFFSNNDKKYEDPYDPDYRVKYERNSSYAPPASTQIERALERGSQYIQDYIHNWPVLIKNQENCSLDLRSCMHWLNMNKLVATHTDKNLGVAVVRAQWLIDQTAKLLSNNAHYRQIDDFELENKLSQIKARVLDCAERVDGHTQLKEFLRSQVWDIDEVELLSRLPRIYVIPKIHKDPWAARPIVPCHSIMQGPAAKFVSKMLKPIIQEQQFLIEGTKHLSVKFQHTKWSNRKMWICTGDIVAWYPSIPLQDATQIVDSYVAEFYSRNPHPHSTLVREVLRWINNDLAVYFQGQSYLQVNGLAMGLACSPDIANLYTCHFEDTNPAYRSFGFYGRYMDDCIAIVYADTRMEAEVLLSKTSFGPLKVVWNVSEYFQPFLDMYVFFDNLSSRIEHKPYRKAYNHHERIPRDSAHPIDVKRGTFISEMSRLAYLCSQKEQYYKELESLIQLYQSRGYRYSELNSWKYMWHEKCWINRTHFKERSSGSIYVMKSEFNSIWGAFNVHELWSTIKGDWLRNQVWGVPPVNTGSGCAPLPEPLQRRLLVSRKRTRQLSDVFACLRRTLFDELMEPPDVYVTF